MGSNIVRHRQRDVNPISYVVCMRRNQSVHNIRCDMLCHGREGTSSLYIYIFRSSCVVSPSFRSPILDIAQQFGGSSIRPGPPAAGADSQALPVPQHPTITDSELIAHS